MRLIATVTAGSIRAVFKNRAPPARAAANTSGLQYTDSVLTVPVAPAFLAVAKPSAINRRAPLAEAAKPRHSFVAVITGAADGVESVASCALSPRTPEYS